MLKSYYDWHNEWFVAILNLKKMAYANNTQEDLHTDANPEPEFHQDESTSGKKL